MQKNFSGKCPHFNDTHSISVNYIFTPITGTLTSNYKKNKFDCTFRECPDMNTCPIYKNAPKTITE